MRSIYYTLIISLFTAVSVQGQSSPEPNFYDLKQEGDEYFEVFGDSAGEDGPEKEFERWKIFWQSRVSRPNSDGGDFMYAHEALYKLWQFNMGSGSNPSLNLPPVSSIQNPVAASSAVIPYAPNEWRPLGPYTDNLISPFQPHAIGRVTSVYADPDNLNYMLAGAETGGLWKTTDGGSSWTNLTDRLGLPCIGVKSILVDPTDKQIIYIATGFINYGYPFGMGVLKSIDGGESWNATDLTFEPNQYQPNFAWKLYMDPSNHLKIFALVDNKVHITIDGGVTWRNPVYVNPNPHIDFSDIVAVPGNSQILYLGSKDRNNMTTFGARLLKSTDGGYNWTDITSSIPVFNGYQKTGTPSDGVFQSSLFASLWKNQPGNGAQWRQAIVNVEKVAQITPSLTTSILTNSPSHTFHKSLPYRVTFDRLQPAGTRLILRIYNSADPTKNVIIYDSGFLTATTSGNVTADYTLNDNYNKFQIEAVANSAYNSSVDPHLNIDNVFILANSSQYFSRFEVEAVGNRIYAAYNTVKPVFLDYSDDGGTTWTHASLQNNPIPGEASKFKMEFAVNTSDPRMMYLGGVASQYSYDGGATWQGGANLHIDYRALSILKERPPTLNSSGNIIQSNDIVLMGDDGGVTLSENGLKTMKDLNGNMNITQFFGVAVTDNNSKLVYAGAQDASSYLFDGSAWTTPVGGDMYRTAFDLNDPSKHYVVSVGRTIEGSGNVKIPFPPDDDKHPFDVPMIIAPDNKLYLGLRNLYRTNAAKTQLEKKLSDFTETDVPAAQSLSAVAVAPSNLDWIYVGFHDPHYNLSNTVQNRMFRTSNGGTTWQPVNSAAVAYSPVKDIVVDPLNPQRVWVAYGAYAAINGDISMGISRVTFSSDGGNNWVDISSGLTGLPVNKLYYLKGSSDILFAGTEVGVYIKRGNDAWEPYGLGLPSTIVTGLDVNYCTGRLVAATYGRGIYEITLSELFDYDNAIVATPGEILTDRNGDGIIKVKGPLRITNGGSLNIANSTVEFTRLDYELSEDQGETASGIIVEPGAALTVSGSTLKGTSCLPGITWDGIQVWGDPLMAAGNDGTATLVNSTIQDATIGVATFRVNQPFILNPPEHGRGFVSATRVNFRNNIVGFHSTGRTSITNASILTNCTFVTDYEIPELRDDASLNRFVVLNNVSGPSIRGCLFAWEGSVLGSTDFPLTNRGVGIYSYNSSYRVTPSEVTILGNSLPLNPNTFRDITKGIDAYSLGGLHAINVKGNAFERVLQGITLNSTAFDEISRNRFTVPQGYDVAGAGLKAAYAIFAYGPVSYLIAENIINASPEANEFSYGVIAHNSGTNAPLIYKNSFGTGKFFAATQAQQENKGLLISCNSYNAVSTNDWLITSGPFSDQGGCFGGNNEPAANQFHANCQGESQINSNVSFTYSTTLNNKPTCTTSDVQQPPLPCAGSSGPTDPVTCSSMATPFIRCTTPLCLGNLQEELNNATTVVQRTIVRNELIRTLLENQQVTQVQDILGVSTNIEDTKILVPALLAQQQCASASEALNKIPKVGIEDAAFHQLFGMLIDVCSSGRVLAQVTPFEKNILVEVAASNTRVSVNAQSLLAGLRNEVLNRVPERTLQAARKQSDEMQPGESLKIFPNPASGSAKIAFNTSGTAKIEVYDLLGKKVAEYSPSTQSGSIMLETAQWKPGIYFVHLYENMEQLSREKLIIVQ
jgi:hypothetical protein